MKIVGIDPGGNPPNGTTGVCVVNVDRNNVFVSQSFAVEGGYQGFCNWLRLNTHFITNADYVICEKFVPYNKAADITPVLIEGVVGYIRPDTVFQPASGKNKAIPDSFLKKQGWYEDHSHHHDARESLRHVLFWLKKQNYPSIMELFK